MRCAHNRRFNYVNCYLLALFYVLFHSGNRVHTSQSSASNVNCRKFETPCQEGIPTKQLHHILPELSPVRQQLPATNLEEVGR